MQSDVLLRCSILDDHGTFPWPSISFFSVALQRAVGQAGYVVFPERFGQNEEPAGSNKELARKRLSLVPVVDLIDAIIFPSM